MADKVNTFCFAVLRDDLIERSLETLYANTEPNFYVIILDQTYDGLDNKHLRDKFPDLMIIRTLRTLGSLAADIQDKPEMKYLQAAFDRAVENRRTITANYRQSDFTKNSSLYVGGFS